MRTNAILKNKYLKQCLVLWEFIESYRDIGYGMLIQENSETVSEEYLRDIYSFAAMQYVIFRHNIKNEFSAENTIETELTEAPISPQFISDLKKVEESEFNVFDTTYIKMLPVSKLKNRNRLSDSEKEIMRAIDTILAALPVWDDKLAAEEEARRQAEQEAARIAEEARLKAEQEAARIAAEEEERRQAKRREAERIAAEEKARRQAEQEAARIAAQEKKDEGESIAAKPKKLSRKRKKKQKAREATLERLALLEKEKELLRAAEEEELKREAEAQMAYEQEAKRQAEEKAAQLEAEKYAQMIYEHSLKSESGKKTKRSKKERKSHSRDKKKK